MTFLRLPVVFIVCFAVSFAGISVNAQDDDSRTPSLKEAANGLFEIGVGLGLHAVNDGPAIELLKSEFNYITPENCMKPAAVQNEKSKCDFSGADRIVEFAAENELKIVGHCLVWAKDDRTPAWFFKNGDQLATREMLLDRMKTSMMTTIGRYRDKIDQWDVVNESLADGSVMWRKSSWQTICGKPDFIVEAFKIARSAEPNAMLIYNDYRSELPSKRPHLFKLIEYLQANDAPIDAIGLQGHYEFGDVPFKDLEFTIDKIQSYGLKIVISEVDIDIVTRGKWWAEDGKFRDELSTYDPYADGCPDDILAQQAEQYAKLFEIYAKNADIIERVTFWNLHDGQSWLNNFPWKRANHPLLFDRNLKRKPAHKAVIEVLQKYQAKIEQVEAP